MFRLTKRTGLLSLAFSLSLHIIQCGALHLPPQAPLTLNFARHILVYTDPTDLNTLYRLYPIRLQRVPGERLTGEPLRGPLLWKLPVQEPLGALLAAKRRTSLSAPKLAFVHLHVGGTLEFRCPLVQKVAP